MTDTTCSVAGMRMAADCDPDWALRRLRQLTRDPGTVAGPVHVELLLMQAELALRLGDIPGAVRAAVRARTVAIPLARGQRLVRPLLTALAVYADLAVVTGAAVAPTACAAWRAALGRAPAPGPYSMLPADGLHAVAAYHGDCRQGSRLLDTVRRSCRPTDPAAAAIAMGLAAMHESCRRPSSWQGMLPPVPGGALHPDLHRPDPGYLASRIQLLPATHTCGVRS